MRSNPSTFVFGIGTPLCFGIWILFRSADESPNPLAERMGRIVSEKTVWAGNKLIFAGGMDTNSPSPSKAGSMARLLDGSLLASTCIDRFGIGGGKKEGASREGCGETGDTAKLGVLPGGMGVRGDGCPNTEDTEPRRPTTTTTDVRLILKLLSLLAREHRMGDGLLICEEPTIAPTHELVKASDPLPLRIRRTFPTTYKKYASVLLIPEHTFR